MGKTNLYAIFFILLTAVFVSAQDGARQAVNLNNKGVALMNDGDNEAAVETFIQALRFQPNYATAYHNLGTAYFYLRQFEKAAGAFQTAIRLYPEYSEAHNQLGVTYLEIGQNEKAVEVLRQAVRLKKNDAVAF
jgi:tetratricopeptide (TPR) repeat protein